MWCVRDVANTGHGGDGAGGEEKQRVLCSARQHVLCRSLQANGLAVVEYTLHGTRSVSYTIRCCLCTAHHATVLPLCD